MIEHQTDAAPTTASQLFRRAAGIQPVGTPLEAASSCTMCGAALHAGDLAVLVTKDTFGESFNNKLDVRVASPHICGDCMALWDKLFLQNNSKSYATGHGVYRLTSNEDVQALFLSPPVAPYAVIFNTRQQQHMMWRTPLGLSQDVIVLRIDDELLYVRRQLALDGARAWRETEVLMKKIGLKGFPAVIERTLSKVAMGTVRSDVAKAVSAHSEAGAAAISALQQLRMAEWWALCALRYIDQDAPATWPVPARVLPAAAEA